MVRCGLDQLPQDEQPRTDQESGSCEQRGRCGEFPPPQRRKPPHSAPFCIWGESSFLVATLVTGRPGSVGLEACKVQESFDTHVSLRKSPEHETSASSESLAIHHALEHAGVP